MQTFAEYLAALRALPDTIAASPTPNTAAVLAYVQTEYIKQHESPVFYQYLGDDANGAPVWKLGTRCILQDISTQLAASVTAGDLHTVPGATQSVGATGSVAAYSCNPALRI